MNLHNISSVMYRIGIRHYFYPITKIINMIDKNNSSNCQILRVLISYIVEERYIFWH